MKLHPVVKKYTVEFYGSLSTAIQLFIAIASSVSTLAGVYAFLGLEVSLASIFIIFVFITWRLIKLSNKLKHFEENMLLELSSHHKFLFEFLKDTYLGKEKEVIIKRNDGIKVTRYHHHFSVNGTSCRNSQEVSGRNINTSPCRGVSFAIVGGSSIDSYELNASYSYGGSFKAPEFMLDYERFKAVFCAFDRPIKKDEKFNLRYSDSWPSSMRKGADGFFFPEAKYFPGGVDELSVTLDFDFRISSIEALVVSIDEASIATCDSQPEPVETDEALSRFHWSVFDTEKDHIYMLTYKAES